MEFCSPYLLLNILIFGFGLWVLIRGSDLFIDAAADIARKYHVSELVIGLTLVSIGTSLPELASSLYAAFKHQPDFIVGNVMGSCITNITLILGLALLIGGKMPFQRALLTRDGVVLMVVYSATVIMTFCCNINGEYGLNWICGIILLLGAVAYCYLLFFSSKDEIAEEAKEEDDAHKPTSITKAFFVLIAGLIMVILGSKAMLDTVVWGARALNISTMLISVTIVAFGTSVPELAVTIAGVFKKRYGLAIGNIMGSCIFNILLIFGACTLVIPIPFVGMSGAVNLGAMFVSGLLLVLCMTGKSLTRWHGGVLFVIYLGFLVYNCRSLINF